MFREMQASYFFKCCQTIGSPVFLIEIHPFKTHGPVISYFPVCLSTSHLLHVTTSSCLITKSLRLAKFGCFHSDLLYCFTARKVSNVTSKTIFEFMPQVNQPNPNNVSFYILTFRGCTVRAYLRNCQVRPTFVCWLDNVVAKNGIVIRSTRNEASTYYISLCIITHMYKCTW
jgi:hypothetical protein